jgi:hypothetical protein
MAAPVPLGVQQLHAWGWLFTPMVAFALGSYCLDSKNSFCFFPGTPYFHRVLQCNVIRDGEEQERKACERDLTTIRNWAMAGKPAVDKSTHWWFKELPDAARNAFNRVAYSAQVQKSFIVSSHLISSFWSVTSYSELCCNLTRVVRRFFLSYRMFTRRFSAHSVHSLALHTTVSKFLTV